jgi:hypothetical protein
MPICEWKLIDFCTAEGPGRREGAGVWVIREGVCRVFSHETKDHFGCVRPRILSGDGFKGFSVGFSDVDGKYLSNVSHIPLCICVYVCR